MIDPVIIPGVTDIPDGKAGAPLLDLGLMVQHADFFIGFAAQSINAKNSTQPSNGVYPVRPPWAVAGVDYPVGIPSTSALKLKVPGIDPLPEHCYAATTAPGTQTNFVNVQQDGGKGIILDGWDFSNVYLSFSYAVTGPVIIRNCKFCYGSTFSSTGAYAKKNHLVNIGCAGSLLFENNYVDTNGPQSVIDESSVSVTLSIGHFPATFLYNAFLRGRARFISTGNYAAQGDFIARYNYFEGLTYSPNEAHAEITLLTWNGVMKNFIWQHNTFLMPKTTFMNATLNGATGAVVPSLSTTPGAILGNLVVDHNVHVGNYAFVNGAYVIKTTVSSIGVAFQNADFVNVTLTNNYLDKTGGNYGFFVASGPTPFTDLTIDGNVNLNTGGPANGIALNGKAFLGQATLGGGVLTVTSINFGGVAKGSRITIGPYVLRVLSKGTAPRTYNVDNANALVAVPTRFDSYMDNMAEGL